MKLAVTYENGNVFEHFGRTSQFKVYTIEDGKIVASEVVDTEGIGHEALAILLAKNDIEVLICGGMGEGAKAALSEAGLEVYSGQSGDADAVVEAYLNGEIESKGVTCDHHEAESSCGGNCGSCGGCHPQITLEGPNAGKTLKVHYTGTFNDGTVFDSSYERNEPLEFVCGAGMMIKGFDAAVVDMNVGEVKNVHLMPEDAYGNSDPNAIFTLPLSELPGAETLTAGEQVYLRNMYGQPFRAAVVNVTDTDITFDANHEMAGKELNFKIEIVSID